MLEAAKNLEKNRKRKRNRKQNQKKRKKRRKWRRTEGKEKQQFQEKQKKKTFGKMKKRNEKDEKKEKRGASKGEVPADTLKQMIFFFRNVPRTRNAVEANKNQILSTQESVPKKKKTRKHIKLKK